MDNPLVDFVDSIARSRGDNHNYNQQIVIGSPIRVRTAGGSPDNPNWSGYSSGKNKIGSGLNMISEVRSPRTLGIGERYDTLVLTEAHQIHAQITWERTLSFIRHYHDLMIQGNSATRTFLYQSWLDINKATPQVFIDYEKANLATWECAASKVNLTLAGASRSDRIQLLPAGGALVDLVERVLAGTVPGITGTQSARLNAIFIDDVHLTTLGFYYMSLVTYSSIYGKSAIGTNPPSELATMSSQTAQALQTIAWNFVNSYYNRASPGQRDMASCRAVMTSTVCPAYRNWLSNQGRSLNEASNCDWLGQTNGGFRWPDSDLIIFPLPN